MWLVINVIKRNRNKKNKMKIEIPNFEVFIDSNISGEFIVNPLWLEHLLNLFYQDYISEVWMEVQDTLMNHKKTIENTVYGIIGQEFDEKQIRLTDERGLK